MNVYTFNNLKFEDGSYLLIKNKNEDCLIDLTHVEEDIPNSFIGTLFYIKNNVNNFELFLSNYLINLFIMLDIYKYFKENIVF